KLEALVTVHGRVASLHHPEEDICAREKAMNLGRRVGIGGSSIVTAERFHLRADDALRGGDIIGRLGGENEAKPPSGEQSEEAHDEAPVIASGGLDLIPTVPDDDSLSSSWPDLFRPSTSLMLFGFQDVDARDKRGHDDSITSGSNLTLGV